MTQEISEVDSFKKTPTHYVPAYLKDDDRLKYVGVRRRETVIPGYWNVCLECDLHYVWCWPISEEEGEKAGIPPAPPWMLECPGGHNESSVFWEFYLPGFRGL